MTNPVWLVAGAGPPPSAPVAVTLLLLILACAFVILKLIGNLAPANDDEGRP